MTKAEFRQLYDLIGRLHSYARGQLRFSCMMYEQTKHLDRPDIDAHAIAAVHATNVLQTYLAGEIARISDYEDLSIEELQKLLDDDESGERPLDPEDAEDIANLLYFKQQSARVASMTDDEIRAELEL